MIEEKSLDELVEPLIIETSDYKKMRLDRTIYTQFKLFNDFVEIRNSNRKEGEIKKEDEILKINIPFRIMNHIVNSLWENDRISIFYSKNFRYKKVFYYLGFQPEKVKIWDKIMNLIFADISVCNFTKKCNEGNEIYYLNEEFIIGYKDVLSNDEIEIAGNKDEIGIRILVKYVEGNKYNVDLLLTDIYVQNKTFKWKVRVCNCNKLNR